MAYVSTAPGKRSHEHFAPLMTGMAMKSSRERGVHVEHAHRLLARLGLGRVDRVALLPEELRRAQEEARAHLPPDDVRPLVDEDGQIAVALRSTWRTSRR